MSDYEAPQMKKKTFIRSSEASLSIYNFQDIVNGLGMAVYYGSVSDHSTATPLYHLTPYTVYSDIPALKSPSYPLLFKTSQFNTPRTAKGTAIFSAGIYEASTSTPQYYLKVQLQKLSGGVTTNISSEIISSDVSGSPAYRMVNVQIPVTQTNFKIGDVLICSVSPTGGESGDRELGVDPMGRNGTLITSSLTNPAMSTQMKLLMPFRINL